jgi:hypothetical protein
VSGETEFSYAGGEDGSTDQSQTLDALPQPPCSNPGFGTTFAPSASADTGNANASAASARTNWSLIVIRPLLSNNNERGRTPERTEPPCKHTDSAPAETLQGPGWIVVSGMVSPLAVNNDELVTVPFGVLTATCPSTSCNGAARRAASAGDSTWRIRSSP